MKGIGWPHVGQGNLLAPMTNRLTRWVNNSKINWNGGWIIYVDTKNRVFWMAAKIPGILSPELELISFVNIPTWVPVLLGVTERTSKHDSIFLLPLVFFLPKMSWPDFKCQKMDDVRILLTSALTFHTYNCQIFDMFLRAVKVLFVVYFFTN